MRTPPDFAALFAASPYPYLLVDRDFVIIGANPSYLQSTGRTADDIVGQHIFDAFPADPADPDSTNLDEVRISIELAIATEKPHTSALLRYAVPRQTPDGTVFDQRYWSAVHTPVFDADGRVAFVAQNAIDVTDLYRFDAATRKYYLKQDANAVPDIPRMNGPQLHEAMTRILSAERSQLQILFNQAPGSIAVLTGPDHVLEMANEAYYELVGHREILGKPLLDALPELAGQGFGELLDGVCRSGEPVVLRESKMALRRTPGGALEDRYVDLLFQPIVGADGRVTGIFAQGNDVTAAHQSSRALSEKVQQLEEVKTSQAFQLALADRIRELDDPDAITAAACALLGQALRVERVLYAEVDERRRTALIRNDWTGDDCASLAGTVHPLGGVSPAVMAALRAGQTVVNHDVGQDPRTAGHTASYARIGVGAELLVPYVKGGTLAVVLTVHSATPHAWTGRDMRLVQETAGRTWSAVEAAQARAALRAADRRKDEFLAMLAHELRNPLAPIGAAADLLQMAQLDEARVRQTSQIIGRQVRHMTSLVDDLLDVSRVTSGLVELDMERLDIRQIVDDAIEQVTPLIRARRHHLALGLSLEAPLVMGDRKRLVQVLANLLNNAAKYTPEGGQLRLDCEVRAAEVLLHVADDGIGMVPDLAERAFDLFAQAERSSDRALGGLGLGLALVKSLVGLHGGSVDCRSPGPGQGSTFTVCLPRLAAVPAGAADARPAAPVSLAQESHLRIMVVDDNVDAAAMLALLLQSFGHEVEVEHGASEALARCQHASYDVFLLDIGLPGMDGNELAQRLRARPATADAMLAAVTGYGQEQDRARTAAAGFNHHLVKPVDMQKLFAILAEVRPAMS